MLTAGQRALRVPRRVLQRPDVLQARLSLLFFTSAKPPRPSTHFSHLSSKHLITKCSPRPFRISRAFSSEATSEPSLTPSFQDPERSDLFYHLIPPPTPHSSHAPAFALSFLAVPPPSPQSATIIGFLPAATEGAEGEAGLNDFVENKAFLDIMQESIREALCEEKDDIQMAGATQLGNGWMNIHDSRNPPALGRVGDPSDLLGSVLVEDGRILPHTYQPMPSYRPCTADGVLTLTPGLQEVLLEKLRRKAENEAAAVS